MFLIGGKKPRAKRREKRDEDYEPDPGADRDTWQEDCLLALVTAMMSQDCERCRRKMRLAFEGDEMHYRCKCGWELVQ